MATRFKRTSVDGASEVLTVVQFTDRRLTYCADLDFETPYVVQITSGPNVGDDFAGLFDLDGKQLPTPSGGSWEAAEDVPADVYEIVEQWGNYAGIAEFEQI